MSATALSTNNNVSAYRRAVRKVLAKAPKAASSDFADGVFS